MTSVIYEHYGLPDPGLSVSSVIPGYLSLRVSFSTTMLNDAELIDPNNYTIECISPSSDIDFACLNVTPEDATYPTYVDLVMTDCKNGADYNLVIIAGKLRNSSGDYMQSGGNSKEFYGVSILPDVLSCQPISSTSMRVTFSKDMSLNDDIKNPTKYSFTDGLKVLGVEVESISSVVLTTSEQVAAHIYDLTVS